MKFIQIAGLGNIGAGVLLLAYWYLYAILLPYGEITTSISILVLNRNWVWINVLGVVGSLLGLLGLVGIYSSMALSDWNWKTLGFSLALIGTAMLLASLCWDTIVWPALANHDPSLLDFQGPIYSSRLFVPFFITAGLIYSAGYLLFGIAAAKSGLYPYWGGMLVAIGAPLFGLGSMFGKYQVVVRSIGITMMCIGLLWLGGVMWGNRT